MKNSGTTREKVLQILNNTLCNGTTIYTFENLYKNSGGGEKMSKSELINSSNWYAFPSQRKYKPVTSVGMTMTEFIKEYTNNNVVVVQNEMCISLYRNIPQHKTKGYLLKKQLSDNAISLNVWDIFDSIEAPIIKETPKWILEKGEDIFFRCRIFAFWRVLEPATLKTQDWKRVWKTFNRLNLSPWEIEDLFPEYFLDDDDE